MKKLSIEEKAKRYDEALERAREVHRNEDDKVSTMEFVFPVLKESEDEKMRKEIINLVMHPTWQTEREFHRRKELVAWLEKQGEKSVDKLQVSGELYEHVRNTCACIDDALSSKILCDINDYLSMANHSAKSAFDMIEKQGEQNLNGTFINAADVREEFMQQVYSILDADATNDRANQIIDAFDNSPTVSIKVEPKFKVGDWVVVNDDGRIGRIIECTKDFADVDLEFSVLSTSVNNIRSWTIQDAKDGDVLATDSWLYMFKYTNNKALIQFHCSCPINGKPHKWCFLPDDCYLDIYVDANIHPATKEQRDLLFQKMKEAGYVWDAEKKEPKKIEQKPAWSEEDETTRNNISHIIRQYDKISKRENKPCWYIGNCLLWMQNIKDRVLPQPKQEWSEEDEKMFESIVNVLEVMSSANFIPIKRETMIPWLKSLKERYTWKPSDEQMADLWNMVCECRPADQQLLQDLYYGLKTLRGE